MSVLQALPALMLGDILTAEEALSGFSNSIVIMLMIVTSLIGAFVSNTGTAAVMMPIVVSLAMSARKSPGQLLMPLVFNAQKHRKIALGHS